MSASSTPTGRSGRALVVEDEPHIRELVSLHLELDGLTVVHAADGDEALGHLAADVFDVVILDLMLPRVDGLAICRAIRRGETNRTVPILMLTARREEADKVLGLDSGADDYLTKPFGVAELTARVRALLRRPRTEAAAASSSGSAAPITAGPLRVDPARRRVEVHGDPVDLTPHEFDVLALLAASPGVVFSRRRLLEAVWPHDVHVTDRSVDTVIKRLRQKVEREPGTPALILTAWGTGYKFADD
jgi:DNA-binding response OmpR family regulator